MSDKTERQSLLKTLTSADLKEICKQHNLKGFSGLKHNQLAKFAADNLEISLEETRSLVQRYLTDKLLHKVRDGAGHFLAKQVEIKYQDDDLIKAHVRDHAVTINKLGTPEFSYICDDKCHDYQYQVKKGRFPFCKHFPAVVAQLIFEEAIDPHEVAIEGIEGIVLEELLTVVEGRKKSEGMIFKDRDIDGNLARLNADLVSISKQDRKTARDKYHDVPENVFEELVKQAFLLLEFDTIPRVNPHGWDILLIAGRGCPPYLVVVECKTAGSGTYDLLLSKPDYLVRLKSYCLDMARDKLVGVYKDYVKYLAIVAPDFPKEIERYCPQFRTSTGIHMTFWPAHVLLSLVNRYRQNPVVTHNWLEPLFQKQKVIDEEDISETFGRAEVEITRLSERVRERLKHRFSQFSRTSSDASFINLDLVMVESLIRDMLDMMAPELLVTGKKGVTGVETVNIKHDYFEIWKRVLEQLGEEFASILKTESFHQVKNPDLKESILRLLRD